MENKSKPQHNFMAKKPGMSKAVGKEFVEADKGKKMAKGKKK
jgi:hypothetical protein